MTYFRVSTIDRMRFSRETSRNFRKIMSYGFISFAFTLLYLLVENGILGSSSYYPATGNVYSFKFNMIVTPALALLFGMAIGWFELYLIGKLFKTWSFFPKLLTKTAIYLFVMISFLLVTAIINNKIDLEVSFLDERLWTDVWGFFFNWAFWSIQIYIGSMVILSLLYAEFTDYLGQEVLRNFFTGKYHRPIEEERIFMFLDMRSSTTHAENLGHVKYFEMLRKYYDDLSTAILASGGLIYQYVGDEVVVSWKVSEEGSDECMTCFYKMKEELKNKEDEYQEAFGVLPTFKAGIHCGKVTTGEIGKIKKDITFTGDVLNTAARIQGMCNEMKTDLLVSRSFYDHLSSNFKDRLQTIGEMPLRGKGQKVEIFKG